MRLRINSGKVREEDTVLWIAFVQSELDVSLFDFSKTSLNGWKRPPCRKTRRQPFATVSYPRRPRLFSLGSDRIDLALQTRSGSFAWNTT